MRLQGVLLYHLNLAVYIYETKTPPNEVRGRDDFTFNVQKFWYTILWRM